MCAEGIAGFGRSSNQSPATTSVECVCVVVVVKAPIDPRSKTPRPSDGKCLDFLLQPYVVRIERYKDATLGHEDRCSAASPQTAVLRQRAPPGSRTRPRIYPTSLNRPFLRARCLLPAPSCCLRRRRSRSYIPIERLSSRPASGWAWRSSCPRDPRGPTTRSLSGPVCWSSGRVGGRRVNNDALNRPPAPAP